MAVVLAANRSPAGVRSGSPITVVDTFSERSESNLSLGLTVPSSAQAGDVMVVWWSTCGAPPANTPGIVMSLDTSFVDEGFKSGSGTTPVYLTLWYKVVGAGEAGRSFPLDFNYGGVAGFYAVIVRTYRFVDSVSPINALGVGYQSGGDVGTVFTGAVNVTAGSVLVDAAIAAAPPVGLGLGSGGVGAWKDEVSLQGGFPELSAGLMDIGYPYNWGGGVQGAYSTGSATNVAGCGWAIALNPVPAPSAPTLTITSGGATVPSGGHADAAQQSGAPFSATIAYTPVRGQGTQEAFLIGREWNSDGSHTGYWNSDAMVWSTTEYWNYRTPTQGATTFTYTFPSSAWADDNTVWKLKVAVKENKLHYSSALSSAFVFTAQAPAIGLSPTVSGTGPKPTVNWTETLDSGATQASWRVRVFTVAQTTAAGFDPNVTAPIKDSGYTTGTALTWTLTSSLASGTAYKAYVQVSDSRGMVSNWTASASFTPSYSQPGAGSLVVVLSP